MLGRAQGDAAEGPTARLLSLAAFGSLALLLAIDALALQQGAPGHRVLGVWFATDEWQASFSFLLDGLGALGTDFVRLSFTHPNKPVEFTGQDSLEGESQTHYRYLLVPIRFAS